LTVTSQLQRSARSLRVIARAAFPGSMRVLSSKRAGLKICRKRCAIQRMNEYRRLASEYEKRADLVDDLMWKNAFFRLAKQYRELVTDLERIPTARPVSSLDGIG
jgi:hypothetical protein